MIYVVVISILFTMILMIRIFRVRIVKFLLAVRAKLQIRSLRNAIGEADADKALTDRKNMVAFNTASNSFETLQKKTLKSYANARKKKNNAKMTDGRKWAMRNNKGRHAKSKRSIDPELIKQIEKDSLYVTN
jgi:hypothetical protein